MDSISGVPRLFNPNTKERFTSRIRESSMSWAAGGYEDNIRLRRHLRLFFLTPIGRVVD